MEEWLNRRLERLDRLSLEDVGLELSLDGPLSFEEEVDLILLSLEEELFLLLCLVGLQVNQGVVD